MTTKTATQHLKTLLVDDGRRFAMVRKTDLAALVAIAEMDPHQGRYLDPTAELRRVMADQSIVIDEAFACLDRNALNALKHGEERRHYRGNNRALLAQAEQQAATIAEMGELVDAQAAEIAQLRAENAGLSEGFRVELSRSMHAESCLRIIRRATQI